MNFAIPSAFGYLASIGPLQTFALGIGIGLVIGCLLMGLAVVNR